MIPLPLLLLPPPPLPAGTSRRGGKKKKKYPRALTRESARTHTNIQPEGVVDWSGRRVYQQLLKSPSIFLDVLAELRSGPNDLLSVHPARPSPPPHTLLLGVVTCSARARVASMSPRGSPHLKSIRNTFIPFHSMCARVQACVFVSVSVRVF